MLSLEVFEISPKNHNHWFSPPNIIWEVYLTITIGFLVSTFWLYNGHLIYYLLKSARAHTHTQMAMTWHFKKVKIINQFIFFGNENFKFLVITIDLLYSSQQPNNLTTTPTLSRCILQFVKMSENWGGV